MGSGSFLIDHVYRKGFALLPRLSADVTHPGTYNYLINTPLFDAYSSSSESMTGGSVQAATLASACANTAASGTACRRHPGKG